MTLAPSALAVVATRALLERTEADPARFVPWLPNQVGFLLSQSRCKQIRQGNQWGGKTWAALAEVIGRCVGRHPLGDAGFAYPPPGPGFEAWVICDSWSQAVQIMGKIWALLPKEDIDPGTTYDPVRGFRGKNPCVKFRTGAILRIKTANQDPKSLASGTIDVALFDEPPPDERVFTEVQQRLQSKGGVLLLSYTPVNAPVEYLRKMVADGLIEDHWSPLTAEALIPVGRARPMRGLDGVLRDQRWIDDLRAMVPHVQAPVVIDGEWEFRSQGAYFEGAWDPSKLVYDAVPDKHDKLVVGIDHGDRPGKQVFVLMAIDDRKDPPSVHVLDVYRDTIGTASPADDARGLLAMLERNGVAWSRLHFVGGDRVHLPGSGKQKSNRDLGAQVRKLLGVAELHPPIRTIKRGPGRGAGSLSVGSRWLFHAMVAERFSVNEGVTSLIEAIPRYTLVDDDFGWKDHLDACRYGLDQWIFSWARGGPSPTIRLHGR